MLINDLRSTRSVCNNVEGHAQRLQLCLIKPLRHAPLIAHVSNQFLQQFSKEKHMSMRQYRYKKGCHGHVGRSYSSCRVQRSRKKHTSGSLCEMVVTFWCWINGPWLQRVPVLLSLLKPFGTRPVSHGIPHLRSCYKYLPYLRI